MSANPVERPVLRIVETSVPAQRRRAAPLAPYEARPAPLLERIIAAAEPGDIEALLIGLILGVLLLAGIIVGYNLDLIASWLRG